MGLPRKFFNHDVIDFLDLLVCWTNDCPLCQPLMPRLVITLEVDDLLDAQRGKMGGQRWFCIFRGLYGHMGCHWKGLDQAEPDLPLLIIFPT